MKRPIFVWTLCLFGFALVACDDATESTPDAVTEELSTPDADAEVAGPDATDATDAESDAATEADGEGSDATEEALVEDADASAAEAGDASESEGESDTEVGEEEVADSEGAEEEGEGLLTIAETATANPDLSILVEAATLTGLADPLSKNDSEYTIFAPTDAAFEALPEGTLDALLANTDALAQILLYHAVFQTFMSEDLMALETVEVLTALSIDLEVVDGVLVLNGVAKVTEADIACSNGVIHIIDTVLTVPAQ